MPSSSVPASSTSQQQQTDRVAPRFRATTRGGGRAAAWVQLAGELDLAAAPLLGQTLDEAAKHSRLVVVDLRDLTRADSSGVGAIVKASIEARRSGRRLVLVRGLTQIDRLLMMTGASNDVEIVDLAIGEPALEALAHVARRDRANARGRTRRARRVVTLTGPSHVASATDALMARGLGREIIDP